MKPAVFYVVEDVAAVDFKEGRAYREALNDRWTVSPPFRHMIKIQTMFFTFAVAVYAGVTAAVTFASSETFAFGWVLGQLFLWAGTVALLSWVITRIGLQREREWWEARMEGEGAFTSREMKRRSVEEKGEVGDGNDRETDIKEKEDPQRSGTTGAHRDDPDPYMDEKKPYSPDG